MRTEQLTHHCDLKRSILKIFGLSNNLPLSDACASVVPSSVRRILKREGPETSENLRGT